MTDSAAPTLEPQAPPLDPAKFRDPYLTAKGERRAWAPLTGVRTLWFNTGTLCNIACENCYIESTPRNDRLVYLTRAEVESYLRQLDERSWPAEEIGLTGGEPFMNPEIIGVIEAGLLSGRRVLVLTNAMRPMMRPRVQKGLLDLRERFGDQLTLRISIDHHTARLHDKERGAGAFDKMLLGLRWLSQHGFRLDAAGRSCWGESEAEARVGYAALFARIGAAIDAQDPGRCILFPEMDARVDVPEITVHCWDILGKRPSELMCATSRMVVKRRGAARPVVVACTLLPYDAAFELGETLAEAEQAVPLNHPHCAKFCVLGGGSCTA